MENPPLDNTEHEEAGPTDTSVAHLVSQALDASRLGETNPMAASKVLASAENETLAKHMTDGEINALADELLQTCEGESAE